MPFSADLRACYSHFEINTSWVYETLYDSGCELKFKSESARLDVEVFIEKRMAQYMVWRVFNHKMDEKVNVEAYDGDVWGFVQDQLLEYQKQNPHLFDLHYPCEKCEEFDNLNDDGLCEKCKEEDPSTD